MSKKEETKFGEWIDHDLRKLFGQDIWIENIQQVGKRGTPDRLICLKGHFVAIELKTDTGIIEPLQVRKLLKINKAGGLGVVVSPTNWSIVREILIKMTEKDVHTTGKKTKNVGPEPL